MDSETLKALKKSIEHWEKNSNADTVYEASASCNDCALCIRFTGPECTGCPVSEKTGVSGCVETPYYAARHALSNWRDGNGKGTVFRFMARNELEFLKSLLPIEDQ